MSLFLQILLIAGFPYLSRYISGWSRIPQVLSPIVLCYLAGIMVRNFSGLAISNQPAEELSAALILLTIPLLLFSTHWSYIRQSAGKALWSFGLCILAGLVINIIAAFLFQTHFEHTWQLAGMLTGIYTGGTPNMQAIGLAIKAPQETIILLNGADVFLGGSYLLLLLSVLPAVLGRVLTVAEPEREPASPSLPIGEKEGSMFPDISIAIGLSMFIAAFSLGLIYLLTGNLDAVAGIILLVTSLGLLGSGIPRIRELRGSYEAGTYFLLMFSVALGLLADLGVIAKEGGPLFLYAGLVMYGTICLHLFMAYLARIDRDTFLITSTAAIYGPAFVPQVTERLHRPNLVVTGIATGILGYALGNYLGIGLAGILRLFL